MAEPNPSAIEAEETSGGRLASITELMAEVTSDDIALLLREAAELGYGCGVGWEMTGQSFYAVSRIPNDGGRLFTVTGADPLRCLEVAIRLAKHRDAETAEAGWTAPFNPPQDIESTGELVFTHQNTPWR